ncbi:hypothetical protein [Thermophilibacter provencensis]|uniref:Integrase n=1 Tax=Thermophilibacter provencensis TaxID=1852386 RepID=A0ABT7V1W8_9ACTN|nr:hypothetical protein [Thermophilibacter provencensis]MDM8270589.1 hypothetical protein [Thermophilibacter provencensis]
MPRRRARSTWGSNEDAGNGRRRLRYWADLHDGRGYTRHSMTIVGSRRDGDETLARLRVEHSADRPTPTLRQAYEAWYLPELRERVESGDMAPHSMTMYESTWRAHVCPAWGNTPVTDIRPLGVQQWLMGMTTESARKSLALMGRVLAKCVLYEAAPTNVAREDYRIPRRTGREHSKDVYTLSELLAALDAVRGTAAYIPAIMCGLASCRVGESLGPLRAEVRETEVHGMTLAVVDIVRQVDRYGHVADRLKTRSSERPVVVPEPWAADVLAVDAEWLCDNGCGEPIGSAVAGRAWDARLADAGLSPIPFRNLRNSWRTYMRWELGVAEDMLEAMMGHVGRNVGEIHYDRPRWEVFAAAVADAWMRYRARDNGSLGTI